MREFLDAILTFIGTATLTDEEWDEIDLTIEALNVETYEALVGVLDSRESVSSTRDRLQKYFEAAGVEVTPPSVGQSNIYMGSVLE